MPPLTIDDPRDPRLEDYGALSDAERLRRHGVFIAEGRMVVRRLLTASRYSARSVLLTPPALAALEDALVLLPQVPVFLVTQDAMNGIAGFDIHRGCLAIGDREPVRGPLDVASASCLLALEAVADPDNIGSLFRNAAALGADGVLLDERSTDPLYRKAIRTSMGATLQLPFARADAFPDALRGLRDQGFALVALTPAPGTQAIADVARRLRGRRVALVLGHEGQGLSPAALEACDLRAAIPMAAGVDSLNVATAAAIGMYLLGGR